MENKDIKSILNDYFACFFIRIPDVFVEKLVAAIKMWALKQVGLDQEVSIYQDNYGIGAARNGMKEEIRKNIGNN